MNFLKSVLERASAWASERHAAPRPRRRLNKMLVLCGLIAGLTLGSATSARAQVWNFVYTGAGFSASGTFTVGGLVWCDNTFSHQCADVTSISGTHSLYGAITGPWYPSVASGPGFPGTNDTSDHIGLYFTAGTTPLALLLYTGTGTGYEYNYTTNQQPTVTGSIGVPEIDASGGLGALAVFFAFGLLIREMFVRRRVAV